MKKDIVDLLSSEFDRRVKNNPRYSLRGFANNLGISVSLLSRIMNRKMPMTLKLLKRISVNLSISPESYIKYENEILSRKKLNKKFNLTESSHHLLELEEFKAIQDWYNFAILEMLNLDDFQDDKTWVANKLSISETEAEMAIERLKKLKLMKENKKGQLEKSSEFITVIDSTFSTVAMRNRQKQILKRAHDVLDVVDMSKRDQSSITMTLDSDLLPEIKNKIRSMRRTLANYIVRNSKKRDQVYEFSVSFFPWTE